MPGRFSFLPVALILFAPAPIVAQVCLGSPTAAGQFAVTAEGTLTERSNDFGLGVEANLPGPLAFRAGVTVEDRDDDNRVTRFEGRGSYDLRSNGISICPVGGADYSRQSESEQSTTVLRIPIGLSVGGRLSLGDTGPAVLPSLRAGIASTRTTVDLQGTSDSTTRQSFFVVGGGSLSVDDLFVRAEAGVDSRRDEPFYTVRVGMRF